jgi:nonribosomal peptide synthetase DhbF
MGVSSQHEPLPYGSIHEWFQETASRHGSTCAVRDDKTALTYDEVDKASTEVARLLADAGVRPGSLVALRLPRSVLVPIAILGIFKHDCAYVPIDPEYPQRRSEFILQDSGAAFILTCDAGGKPVVERGGSPAAPTPLPPRLAYAIYTSGSTGVPKGVLVGHEQVVALMHATAGLYDVNADDVWTLFSSYSFDFSVWEMWGALLFGGELVVVPKECAQDPQRFVELLDRTRVTVLNQVPTAFTYLVRGLEALPRPLKRLRHVIFGGEEINTRAIHRWWKLDVAPSARLANMYGITETTVHVTSVDLTPALLDEPRNGTPIGRPLPHMGVDLLDEDGIRVPVGTPGEIVVAGRGVAFGYLHRKELTEQRFRRLAGAAGLAYHSGDWAVQDELGSLYFLGRRDFQVQLRGHRIELAEVEAAVLSHPRVRACAVTTPENVLGEPVLTAHVSPEAVGSLSVSDLRAHVSLILPKYMVPARFVCHAELPRTAAGKVDRAALDR